MATKFIDRNYRPTVPIFDDPTFICLEYGRPLWRAFRVAAPLEVVDAFLGTYLPTGELRQQDTSGSILYLVPLDPDYVLTDTYGSYFRRLKKGDCATAADAEGNGTKLPDELRIRIAKTIDPNITELQIFGQRIINSDTWSASLKFEHEVNERMADEGLLTFEDDPLAIWDWEEAASQQSVSLAVYIALRRLVRRAEYITNRLEELWGIWFNLAWEPFITAREGLETYADSIGVFSSSHLELIEAKSNGTKREDNDPRGPKAGTLPRVKMAHELLKRGIKRTKAFKDASTDCRTYNQWCKDATGEEPIEPM